ncbi:MAG: GWxTD domain-containing protein, partial [Ignavibacteria bacterium]|nr:GWxTD domain-containing protein [Ignavibacteria bacterium]
MRYIYKILFLILLVNFGRAEIIENKFNYSIWLNPPQLKENFVLNFNLRYDLFVFEKNLDGLFQSSIQVQVEILDEQGNFVTREIREVNILCTNYEQTISKNLFYTNKFVLSLPQKKLSALVSLIDSKNFKDYHLKKIDFSLEESKIQFPIFVNKEDLRYLYADTVLTLFSNSINYAQSDNILLIPSENYLDSLLVVSKYDSFYIPKVIRNTSNFSGYALDYKNLFEGEYKIILRAPLKNEELKFKVIWINKPLSIQNLDFALKIMKYLFDESSIDSIKSQPNTDQYYHFITLWKKLDPTPLTPFNELLNEVYIRADEANDKYRTLKTPDGALSDRGRIYILYGSPTEIKRGFSTDGKATELSLI